MASKQQHRTSHFEKRRYLELHRGRWRVSVPVPKEVRNVLGVTRLKHSLRTDSLELANCMKGPRRLFGAQYHFAPNISFSRIDYCTNSRISRILNAVALCILELRSELLG